VVDTFGMQLEPFHRFLLAPFTRHRVTTLSHLSSRMPPAQEEGYNPDGHHVRCFRCAVCASSPLPAAARAPTEPARLLLMLHRQLLLCQMQGAGATAAAALAQAAPLPHPLWATGQAVFHFYKHRLPAIDPSFADSTKLKVGFECGSFTPARLPPAWHRSTSLCVCCCLPCPCRNATTC
jgi:hypothetical protein